MMTSTALVTSHSSVLMCISGFSGASYGADMPVKSIYKFCKCLRLREMDVVVVTYPLLFLHGLLYRALSDHAVQLH